MALKYSQKVIQHFTVPQNVGSIENADAFSTEGSPACGDMITYSMKINPETKVIEDIKFRSFGCASNIATASVATVLAKGRTIEQIKRLKHSDLNNELGGLPAVKLHCSVLAIEGLKSAVKRWEIEHGFAAESEVKLSKSAVERSLKGVVNPHTGEILINSDRIKEITIDDEEGSVFVEIILKDEEDKFASNIEEEIREHIKGIPGVRSVMSQFVRK